MNKATVLRNILAVILGVVIGSIVNMSIINISGKIIPPPPGTDLSTMEGLTAALPFFEPKHFLMPFLAHALGTFSGALIAALVAASHKMRIAMVLGFFFLIGGIGAVYMLPAPMWFNVMDLVIAYLPMGWLAGRLGGKGG
jgi:hypothetical protein